ncbi:reverse transcriptase domain-containing protein [Tanacetum coccineum]
MYKTPYRSSPIRRTQGPQYTVAEELNTPYQISLIRRIEEVRYAVSRRSDTLYPYQLKKILKYFILGAHAKQPRYAVLITVFGEPPYQFNYLRRRLTMEEMLAKFIDEGRREHEEMEIFIKEFRTTNELLLKTRSNLLIKEVTTRGEKVTSEVTRSKEINETGINKNEPPRFEQDVKEKPHDDGVKNKSSSICERTTQPLVKPQQSSVPFSNRLEKALRRYGVTHKLFTAYHPQSNGQTEVTNRAIKRILERSVGYNPKGWSEKLNYVLWAFRTAYKTPTGCTPFRLVYRKACHLPVEIEHKAHWALKQCNMDLTLASESRLMKLNELAKLRDGDKVLLYNSRLKMYLGKLKSKWSGPNIVKTVYLRGAIEITDRDGSFKINGQRLKKYYGGDNDKEDDEVIELENDEKRS